MSLISKTSILGEIILIILISFLTNSMRGRLRKMPFKKALNKRNNKNDKAIL